MQDYFNGEPMKIIVTIIPVIRDNGKTEIIRPSLLDPV